MAFYPDLDAGPSGSTQPVTVGAEAEGINGVTAVQGVKVLALIQVPQHGLTILQILLKHSIEVTIAHLRIHIGLFNCQKALIYLYRQNQK